MMLDTAMLEFEELTACPICGGIDIPILTQIRDLGILSYYCNCQRCGQLFLNPRMTDEQTTAYYAGMYRDGLTDNIPRFMERDTFLQQSRAAAQLPFIKAVKFGKYACRALDIGCSLGYLLELLDEGWIWSGVEPDTRYHDYEPAKRFEMYASVDDLPQSTEADTDRVIYNSQYDLITLSHSLEHLNHPREFMTDLLTKHAHQDTIVMVDVPNTETHRDAFRIHHPYAFTPFTLTGLFERIGWKLASMHFYGLDQEWPDRKYLLAFFRRA
jgi:SAM-dependent methyltransferase